MKIYFFIATQRNLYHLICNDYIYRTLNASMTEIKMSSRLLFILMKRSL